MDAKDEIKTRLSIEDVVGEYVQLKRAGRSFKGLSPFNTERTPSFVVSPDKQIWHDFSSGKGGDMFSFVMELEGLDFRGALELLARKAGVDLDQYKQSRGNGPSGKTKERLYEALELATRFYQTQLRGSQVALTYALKKRAFSKETAVEWRLGYSPNTGSALMKFLKDKGYTSEEIKLAGLSGQRGNDMFRGRLMIPLCDPSGRVIGFTARILADDPNAPKYINTPATPLYDKSRHVFGMHLAKEAIRKNNFSVLAEGNLDVITSHQAGVRQVVATAGTALTEPHLKALNRLSGDIRLCFDADRAGIAATERAIPVAAKVGVSLSVITIPSGKDPDELIRQDVQIWQDIITKPQYAVDWLIERYMGTLDLDTAQGKKELSDVVLRVVRQLPDSVEQDHYIGRLAQLLSVNKQALDTKLATVEDETKPVLRKPFDFAPQPIDKNAVEQQRNEEGLLAITFLHPKLRTYLYPLTPDMFGYEPVQKIFLFLQEHPDYDGTDKQMLQEFADYVKMLSLIYDEDYAALDSVELENQVVFLRRAIVEDYVETEKAKNKASMNSEDYSEALKRDVQLNELLKIIKGGRN